MNRLARCVARLSICCGALPAAVGCQTARVADPLTNQIGGNDLDQQMEFLHRLAERPVTSNDEAFHALLLFLDGQDVAADYRARVGLLRSRGMLSAAFDQGQDRAIERGTLGVALVRALSIKGGAVMRLLGPSERYAVRELTFLEIFPPSSPNQTFSGSEFITILSKAEEYQKTGGRPARAGAGDDVIRERPEAGENPAPQESSPSPTTRPGVPPPLQL